MSHAYVIHIAGKVAGIVARDHDGQAFRFFASSRLFDPLEGALFDAPQLAERAARRLYKARGVDASARTESPRQFFHASVASSATH